MEPMALGNSPTNSPTPYLPSFLMGDPSAPSPQRCTLSPIKRNLSFSQSSSATSPTDGKRNYGQKTLFGYQPVPPSYNNYHGASSQNQQNASMSGPPTQGLFDSLRLEQHKVHSSPMKNYGHNESAQLGTSMTWTTYPNNQSFNDSYLNASNFNISHFNASRMNSPESRIPNAAPEHSLPANFWVTVFGFPPTATSLILSQFSECGTIIDKVFAPENGGNWVHLRFGSRLESCRALNYNERILGNNLMIGVTKCKHSDILEKEKCYDHKTFSRGRPLAQVAFHSAQSDLAVVASPNTPQRTTGIVNKFMDTLFGW